MESLVNFGLLGLFVGTFLASTLLPLSSEILVIGVLSLGYNAWLCLFVATLGNWLGGISSYLLGYAGNMNRIEKRFKNSKERLAKQKLYIDKYGQWLSFFAWLPIVGDFFSLALGFYKINFVKTAIWMFIGRLVRFFVIILLYVLYSEKVISYFTVGT